MYCERYRCTLSIEDCKKRRELGVINPPMKWPIYLRCEGCIQWKETQNDEDVKRLFDQYYSPEKVRDRLRFRLAEAEEILNRVREIAEQEMRPFQYQVLLFLKEGIVKDKNNEIP